MKREADTVVLLRLWRKRGPRPELDTMEDEGPRPYCYRYSTSEEEGLEAVVLLILWRKSSWRPYFY